MNGDDQVTLGEVARSQARLENTLLSLEHKLDSITQAGVVRRLDEVEERLRWYGRWILGLVGALVASGIITVIAAGSR